MACEHPHVRVEYRNGSYSIRCIQCYQWFGLEPTPDGAWRKFEIEKTYKRNLNSGGLYGQSSSRGFGHPSPKVGGHWNQPTWKPSRYDHRPHNPHDNAGLALGILLLGSLIAKGMRGRGHASRANRTVPNAQRDTHMDLSFLYPLVIIFLGLVGIAIVWLVLSAIITGASEKVAQWRYPPIETRSYSTGWFGAGIDYRITGAEGGEIEGGAHTQKAYVSTEAVSEDDFKKIALDIEDEYQNYDFLWVELYEESIYDTTGVVVVINSEAGEQFLGGGWTTDGGVEGDGVYVLTGSELDDYPSGQEGFEEVQ